MHLYPLDLAIEFEKESRLFMATNQDGAHGKFHTSKDSLALSAAGMARVTTPAVNCNHPL